MEFKFKKKFGQNFLIDKNITKKIANIIDNKDNSLVIEIGPGDGRLTKELCNLYTNVLCYEIDTDLKDSLEKNLKQFTNCKIIFSDFLTRNIKKDIKDYNYSRLYIVSNLPYYITTPIIEKIVFENMDFKEIVFMVQQEVGNKLTATPGNKAYNALTVLLNYSFSLKKEFFVNKNSFVPKPNVDSVVISLTAKKNKEKIYDYELFTKLIKDSFKYKRKTIINNLKNYDIDKIEKVLNNHGLNFAVRAEQLSYQVFCDLANNIYNNSI